MKNVKTEPITIRIPVETKRILRDVCSAQKIDIAEYVRQLIDRDLSAKDTVPVHEKKFIERVVEQQTQQMLDYFTRNIGEKVDKIYYNMGTKYDQAKCKGEELYAYMQKKHAEINRACPEDMDAQIKRFSNTFTKSDDWDKTFKIIKNEIDKEVIRRDYLYKSMDYAAEKCREDGIINIFADYTLYDYGQMFNKYISDEKEINYSDIFEQKIKSEIDAKTGQHFGKASEAYFQLIRYAGIEDSKIDTEIQAGQAWLRQLRQSVKISETAQKIHATIKPKSILSKAKDKIAEFMYEEKEVKKT